MPRGKYLLPFSEKPTSVTFDEVAVASDADIAVVVVDVMVVDSRNTVPAF